jgi:hypothetical protein
VELGHAKAMAREIPRQQGRDVGFVVENSQMDGSAQGQKVQWGLRSLA